MIFATEERSVADKFLSLSTNVYVHCSKRAVIKKTTLLLTGIDWTSYLRECHDKIEAQKKISIKYFDQLLATNLRTFKLNIRVKS